MFGRHIAGHIDEKQIDVYTTIERDGGSGREEGERKAEPGIYAETAVRIE